MMASFAVIGWTFHCTTNHESAPRQQTFVCLGRGTHNFWFVIRPSRHFIVLRRICHYHFSRPLLKIYCTYSKKPDIGPVDCSLQLRTLNLSRTSRLARTFLSFAGKSCNYVHSRRFPLSNDEINYSIKLDLCGLILTDMICYGYLFQTSPLLLLIQ